VAEPYSNFLQIDLYKTFFDAYTLVQPPVRKAMENLLKTWKEPVPGSTSNRPVFPPEVVRPIENALIKFKTVALQGQRPGQMDPQMAYRNTPTPPQYNGQYPPPAIGQRNQFNAYGGQLVSPLPLEMFNIMHIANEIQPTPAQHYTQPAFQPSTPTQPQFQAPPTPSQSAPVDYAGLKSDISSLISTLQIQFAATPHDRAIQKKLNALLDLQKLVTAGAIPPQALQSVRDQVTAVATSLCLQLSSTPQPTYQPPQWQQPAPLPQWKTPVLVPQPYQAPQTAQPPYVHPATQAAQPSPPILAPAALNGLQALLSNGQKSSTPPMRSAMPALQNASHSQLSNVQSKVSAMPASNPSDLLAALAKSGVLSNLPPASAAPPIPAPAFTAPPPSSSTPSAADLLKSLQGVLPPTSQNGTPVLQAAQLAGRVKVRVPMTAAALKGFRPELVRTLYDEQPNQCSTCGRRFLATEDGRAKKARHLDWHFRTNHRMADAQITRGQHRNWYVDEVEWIRLTEFDPSTTTAEDATAAAAKEAKKQKRPEDLYVKAPPGMTSNTCSICQEEMRSSYSDELQDWIFANAVVYNGKICHATCVEEIKGTSLTPAGGAMAGALGGALGAGQRQRSATPDSTLGKRKAEGVLAGVGTKMRTG
jgi:pre-mRNA cleavage complex 2 protein Pcf11